MQFNTFISSTADLERCVNAPNLQEVLLEPTLLARQGRLSDEQVQQLAADARQRGLRPVLVWDILMPERVMSVVCQRLSQWNIQVFDAVRVCDPGAAWWVKTHWPDLPLQLIVETGNHNLEALRGWCEVLQGSLERLVLSIELPEYQLIEYCQTLPVGCEILGVGQILLFYSPRSLLSSHLSHPNQPEEDEVYLETTVASEESGNRPFPTIETVHGTLMFLDKDQFILDQLSELEAAGLQTVRLDLRHLGKAGDVAVDVDQISQQVLSDPGQLRSQWLRPTRAPFFKVNRTTSIFSRMKSKSKLSQYQEKGLAEILSGESGQYILFQTLQSFERSQVQHLVIPTGERLDIPEGFEFRDLNDHVIEKCDREQLLITRWIKKAMPGSLLVGHPSKL